MLKFYGYLGLVSLAILSNVALCAKHYKSQIITFVNKTGEDLSLITLDAPFNKATTKKRDMIRLASNHEVVHPVRGKVAGWIQSGVLAEYTIIDPADRIIVFIKNRGLIKTLHGRAKDIDVSNSKPHEVILRTKNPNRGNEDCIDCAERCYDRDDTLEYCRCLNFCWDRTRDLQWVLQAGQTKMLKVAEGTNVGIYEEDNDDDDYYDNSCYDGNCYRTVTKKTTYMYP